VLQANVTTDWKVIARYKHSSLFGLIICNEGSFFITLAPEGVLVDRGPVSRLSGEGDVEESDGEGENPVDEDEELGVFEEADISGRIFVLPGHDLLLQDAPGEVRNLDQKFQNLSPLSLTSCQNKLEYLLLATFFGLV
jgi:hypothetical protein